MTDDYRADGNSPAAGQDDVLLEDLELGEAEAAGVVAGATTRPPPPPGPLPLPYPNTKA
ncbi:MAG: hypothetical protein ABSD82_04505 [Solirubrobacteraceae bacterium]|jgi:hypothetical protein